MHNVIRRIIVISEFCGGGQRSPRYLACGKIGGLLECLIAEEHVPKSQNCGQQQIDCQ
jgi:hypothetical protein